MKLKSLTLHHFQAHEELEMALAPGITSIVGPTDAGKSAVIRALRWVCLNDLSGDAFIREGAKRARVVLEVDEDCIITRTKGSVASGLNTYELNDQEYRSFAQGIPQDIAQVLNLNETNFQSQHDAPFWFADTPGEVSRKLNAVVDLAIIDNALSAAATEVRRAQERQSLAKERLAEVEKEWEAHKDVAGRVAEFQALQALQEKQSALETRYRQMEDWVRRARSYRLSLKTAEEKEADLQVVLQTAKEALQVTRAVQDLDEAIAAITKWEKKSLLPPDFDPVILLHDSWAQTHTACEKLNGLLQRIHQQTTSQEKLAAKVLTAESRFRQETQGKRCPLCQNVLP